MGLRRLFGAAFSLVMRLGCCDTFDTDVLVWCCWRARRVSRKFLERLVFQGVWALGPRGGVVTQRSAKPCTPVQFRTWPPIKSNTWDLARRRSRPDCHRAGRVLHLDGARQRSASERNLVAMSFASRGAGRPFQSSRLSRSAFKSACAIPISLAFRLQPHRCKKKAVTARHPQRQPPSDGDLMSARPRFAPRYPKSSHQNECVSSLTW